MSSSSILSRPPSPSTINWFASLPESERTEFLTSLTPTEKAVLLYRWEFWARPNQRAPGGSWRYWILKAGRGAGKSRSGSEWIREGIESGQCRRVALVGRTAADVRDVIVEGESGVLAVCPPWNRPHYEPSRRRLTWPNGAVATTYSADEPDLLRGPQHDRAYCDELASWRHPEAFDNLKLGLRLGDDPRCCVTTTPKPRHFFRKLLQDPDAVVTGGSTYDNRGNLAPQFFDTIIRSFAGSRLGRQEIAGELLEDVEGALWTLDLIHTHRVTSHPDLARVVVAVDPSGGDGEGHDEQGIVVAGRGTDGLGYVLADRSCHLSPDGWGRRAVRAWLDFEADAIVCEANFGGDMVTATIRTAAQAMAREGLATASVPVRTVHASRGKRARAEPIAALYEQGRIKHDGIFDELEDQMRTWAPGGPSPDRVDSLVWALSDLMLASPRTLTAW